MEVKKTTSPGLNAEKKAEEKKAYTPNAEQQEIYSYYIDLITKASDQRSNNCTELNDLDYETDHELNKRYANTYQVPKKNRDEVRISSPTIEKKVEVVANELLSLNLQPEINAFDTEDNEIKNLGKDFEDIVRRSNEIEKDEDFWREAVMMLLTQRAVFVRETNDKEQISPSKKIHIAKKRLMSGLQVYLGDITIPAYRFQEQPYIILYFKRSYREAKRFYQSNPNWDFVKAGTPLSDEPYYYRMNALEEDDVEELHIIDPSNNEYMVMINGVLMFDAPEKCPWTITDDRRYNMTMVVLKGMGTDFAYGIPLVISARVVAALKDESLRLLVRKFQQAIEPPTAVKQGKIFTRDIWKAGAIIQGAKASDFEVINPNNQGVNASEFNFFSKLEELTSEAVGTPDIAEAASQKGEQTATEVQLQQRNFIKNLGFSILSLMVLKRNVTYLRLYNQLENFTKPTKRKVDPFTKEIVNVFRRYSISGTKLRNGKKGRKVIQFSDQELTPDDKQDIFDFNRSETKKGRPTEFRVINVNRLHALNKIWFVTVTQTEREGSALERVMYADKFKQAQDISEITGRKINADKAIEDYETTWRAPGMFEEGGTPQSQQAPEGAEELQKQIAGAEQTPIQDNLKEGVTGGQTDKPSINRINNE